MTTIEKRFSDATIARSEAIRESLAWEERKYEFAVLAAMRGVYLIEPLIAFGGDACAENARKRYSVHLKLLGRLGIVDDRSAIEYISALEHRNGQTQA